ncbi:MAG: hypothetical protein VXW58_02435, partial [Pseudomonadota bacterium]|nr:hypothetical protein [Pseudomonadota bacterium]
ILRPGGTLACFEPRPHGYMTEVIKLIEDETTVRTEAQALLADPPAPFTRHAAQDYTLTRRFADVDDLLRTVVSVDPARAENAAKPDVQREIRTRFDRYGQPQPDGAIHLEQPAGFYLLRRT